MQTTIKMDSSTAGGKRKVFYDDELSHHIEEKELQETIAEAQSGLWLFGKNSGTVIGERLF